MKRWDCLYRPGYPSGPPVAAFVVLATTLAKAREEAQVQLANTPSTLLDVSPERPPTKKPRTKSST